MIEFLIVGNGLAAHTFAHTLKNHNITFNILGNTNLSNCSNAAAGIWNPIVFKRMTKSWLADELINYLIPFYSEIEKKVNKKIITLRPILKSFFEEQEKNLWKKKADEELSSFLDKTIYNTLPKGFVGCKTGTEFSIVKNAGNINVSTFIKQSEEVFKESFIPETFVNSELKHNSLYIEYKNIKYKNIVFCEGHLVKNNPYFNWVPLKPAKGETVTVNCNNLNIDNAILNKNGFILNSELNTFKVGATYEWHNLTDLPTEKGKYELCQKLNHLITCQYQITDHQAGVRPSSSDRRPIIGTHPKYKNLHLFNGLGTKGVMLSPYFANKFVLFYQNKQKLLPEVDLTRFYNLYSGKD